MRSLGSFRQTGTNLLKAKEHNHSVVLDVVRAKGPISRAELAKVTALSRQTIQNIVSELAEADLVILSTSPIKGRGHPGVDVSLNPESAFSLGFHVDRSFVRAVVCDLSGREIWSQNHLLSEPTIQEATAKMLDTASAFRNEHEAKYQKLVGVGLAAPGPFNTGVSQSIVTEFSELGDPGYVGGMKDKLGVPIVLENDAAAGAIGEFLYGDAPSELNFTYLMFGMGLGAGFFLEGMPYRGVSQNAGEISHINVEPNGLPCYCGRRGCLEQYLSQNALCDHLGLSPTDPDLDVIFSQKISAAHPETLRWFDQASNRLLDLVSTLGLVLDPGEIVIGGTASKSFLCELLTRFETKRQEQGGYSVGSPNVRLGTAQANTVAMGAAAASLEAHFYPSLSQLLL